jgi:hypothetical protein
MRFVAAIAVVSALCATGCATGSSARRDAIDRVLAEGLRKAQPTEVVAVDLGIARAAREDGQWAALRDYAAPAAVLHLPEGPVDADKYLRGRPEPGAPSQWSPEAVWMSCDSRVAVSHGKYVEPDGTWGYYATAWVRERDGGYRWTYMLRAPDTALTQRQKNESKPVEEDGTIIVQAVPMIRGVTGDCLPGAPSPQPPVTVSARGSDNQFVASPDGTLVWERTGSSDGRRRFSVLQADQGRLEEAFAMEVVADGRVTVAK